MFKVVSFFAVALVGSMAVADTTVEYGVDATGQPVQVLNRNSTTTSKKVTATETAPVAAPSTKPVPTETLAQRELNKVYFDLDQAALNSEAKKTLGQAAAWMKKNPNAKVTIEAEADESGTSQHNLALSKKRAASVSGYLKGLGVSSARLTTKALGERHERKASIVVN